MRIPSSYLNAMVSALSPVMPSRKKYSHHVHQEPQKAQIKAKKSKRKAVKASRKRNRK